MVLYLIISNYVWWLIWGNDSVIYLFDCHSKDENGSLWSFGTRHSLENYIKSVYRNTYPLTFYFQVQFVKVHCSPSAKKDEAIVNKVGQILILKNRIPLGSVKKKQIVKKRCHDEKEPIKHMWKIQHQKVCIRKQSISKILKCSCFKKIQIQRIYRNWN